MFDAPTRQIGEQTYRLQFWSTTKALDWMDRLIKLLGEPALMFLSGYEPPNARADDDPYVLAFSQALRNLGGAKLSDLMKEVIRGAVFRAEPTGASTVVLPESGPSDFDVYYVGPRPPVVGKLFLFVLEENLGPFFGELHSYVKGRGPSSSSALSEATAPPAP